MSALRVWLDIECTGLDPNTGHLLEVACVATEPDAPEYREVVAQSWVVRPSAADWRDTLDTYVLQMHAASGLLADVQDRGLPLATVEEDLVKFLSFFGNPAPGREPIAGSSPHFDRRWLDVHLPTAARYFSHRTFDASTLKRFALDHGCAPWDQHDGSGGAAHRALADVRYSIETARTVARLLAVR